MCIQSVYYSAQAAIVQFVYAVPLAQQLKLLHGFKSLQQGLLAPEAESAKWVSNLEHNLGRFRRNLAVSIETVLRGASGNGAPLDVAGAK